ncbi:putative ribonuclease H-like domain-containing protein [Tanacetum coccineum]|uniref:Ribonuclease H-like domain-containing protein n=1 Tax=Tanacetum coccineum TaxID=301880 RepID=A0ABQ5E1X2_9ASTR
MEAGTTSTTLTAKLLILNRKEYDLWLIRIEQYFLMTDYSLWEVIPNGNKVLKRKVGEVGQEYEPTTAEEKQDRRNEMKARGTLLMALSNKDQLKFHSYKDAKLLMEAIEKRNKVEIETISLDDLYNNLKIYELELKDSTNTSQNSQNVAFVSSNSTNSNNSTNEADNTAYEVSTAHTQSNPTSGDNLKQIDPDDLEEMDLQWEMAMLAIRARRFIKRTGRQAPRNQDNRGKESNKRTMTIESHAENALVAQDGIGGYDWSYQDEEEHPTNFTLMAYTSLGSSSSSDSEVDSCSKTCVKAYATLKEQYDNLNSDYNKSQFNLVSYKAGLKLIEARLAHYKKSEAVFEESINVLKLEVRLRDNALVKNKKKLEKAEKERDELKLTLEKFQNSSKSLNNLLESQVSDKFKTGLGYNAATAASPAVESFVNSFEMLENQEYNKSRGYHAVPPPYTRNFIPHKPDLAFIDEIVESENMDVTTVVTPSDIEKVVSNHESAGVKNNGDVVEPKTVRENNFIPPIIEDWNSNDESKIDYTVRSSIDKIKFVKLARETVEKVETPKQNKHYPRGNQRNWNNLMSQRLGEHLFERFSPFKNAFTLPPVSNVTAVDDTVIFDSAYDDEDVGAEDDLNNMETTINVEAMQEELLQFKLQKVWTLVDLPNGKRAIGTKWVFRNKKDEREIVVRNKARLAYASFMGFIVYQMDVKSAFLYGTIEEDVYVCQPPGFEDPHFPDKVYKVEKALYGLHQAPKAWYETLSTYLIENGFRRGTIDKTVFIKKDKGLMHKRFQISSMRELTFFLGLQVQQKEDRIFISQDKYVAEILKKFDFATVKIASTPIETNKALVKDEEVEVVDVHLYRSMIGSLMYLTASRPDIMFVVCACARFQVTPKTSHLHAVKRIFRYLKGQPKLGFWYPRDLPFDLEAFSDSDYVGASLDRKSTTRGCQFLGKRLISWQCKKQTIVANSTTEAEYVAAAHCCGQVLWIQNQMLDYGFNFMNTKIYIDNESIICIVKNLVFHSKTKHIEIRYHFIRDSYEKKLIQVIKIHTDYNVADLLTKAKHIENLVGDEAIHKELGDRMERAATTASSLVAEHDCGNINRTQSMATLNEPSPYGIGSVNAAGGGFINTSIQIEDLDANVEVTLVDKSQRRQDEDLMFDTGVLDSDEITAEPVTTAGEVVTTASKAVSTVGVEDSVAPTIPVTTAATTPQISKDELTLAQTLMEIKAAKPKAVTTAATTVSTESKAKGVSIQEPKLAFRLHAKEQAELEKIKKERDAQEEANIAIIEKWNEVQAKMEADMELAQRLQSEEQEQYTDKEKENCLWNSWRRRGSSLQEKERLKRGTDHPLKLNKEILSEATEVSPKRVGDELESDVSKKQKVDEQVEDEKGDDQEEMKKHIEIVVEEEIAIDAIPLATKPLVIIEYKLIREGIIGHYQLIRADESFKIYSSMIRML